MCAVSRYTLYVNGDEVARGPVRANPRRQPYDVIDLAPHLKAGENVIGVIAWRYDGATAWWPRPRLRATCASAASRSRRGLGDGWLVSDETWTGAVLDGWTETRGAGVGGRGTECIDLRALPPGGWAAPDGIDPMWESVATRRALAVGRHERPASPVVPGNPARGDGRLGTRSGSCAKP